MKLYVSYIIFFTLLNAVAFSITAQTKKDLTERGTVFTVSGVGLGITGGKTNDVISPKVSTKIGIDASIGKKGIFVYPSVNFLIFKFSQKEVDPDYTYSISLGGRTAITSFLVPVGYRHSVGKFNISVFAGPGAAQIVEPRLEVNTQSQEVELSTHDKYTVSLTAGIGAEYLLGQFALFAEASHLYNVREFQGRTTYIFPVYIGFKSNISNIFKGKDDR